MKEGLKRTYEGVHGRVYVVQSYTEKYAFLRSDHHGHIERIMVRRDASTGEVASRLVPVRNFRPGTDNAGLWMMQHSEHAPQQFVSDETLQTVDGAKECRDCTEEEIRQWNLDRLEESRRLKESE